MAVHGHDLAMSAAENYRAFAEDAHGRSPASRHNAITNHREPEPACLALG